MNAVLGAALMAALLVGSFILYIPTPRPENVVVVGGPMSDILLVVENELASPRERMAALRKILEPLKPEIVVSPSAQGERVSPRNPPPPPLPPLPTVPPPSHASDGRATPPPPPGQKLAMPPGARASDLEKPLFHLCDSPKHSRFQGFGCELDKNFACWGDPDSINTCAALADLCLVPANQCTCPPYPNGTFPGGRCKDLFVKPPTFKTDLICSNSGTKKFCKSENEKMSTYIAELKKMLGPKGTLLMIGDSTLRYQVGFISKCFADETCVTPGIKGTKKNRVCNLDHGKIGDAPDSPIIIFDEIAGGSFHAPWINGEMHIEKSFERLNSIVDLKQRGKLFVYTNYAALHLFFIDAVGGWSLRGNGGGDFAGFMEAGQRFKTELAFTRKPEVSISGYLVMTPHWVCADKMPASMQAAVIPEMSDGVVYNAAIEKCVKFVGEQTRYQEWSSAGTRSDADRLALCHRGQLSEEPRVPGGSPYLRKVWSDAVKVEQNAGATDVGIVDTYLLTKAAGCSETPDGRHYPDPVVFQELEELLKTLQALGQ